MRPCPALNLAPGAPGANTSDVHHAPRDFSDRFALAATRAMRGLADLFFAQRYGHRAVVLDHGTVVHSGSARELKEQPELLDRLLGEARGHEN